VVTDQNLERALKKRVRSRRMKLLWRGPEKDGITQSLLSRFLGCRERFRLLVVEGLRPTPTFDHRIEYGRMWHVCEATPDDWANPLQTYCEELVDRYQTQQEQIQHWYNVCKVQFSAYVDYWQKRDREKRTTLLSEQVFNVPYELPSGRVVRLRGKWDGVEQIGKSGIWLLEHKTKGAIREEQLQRQLKFDLQTMFYLVALRERLYLVALRERLETETAESRKNYEPIQGVRYNVVRRPLSGGKHSIRKHQPTKKNPAGESDAEFYARLAGLIQEEPEHYFMRWKVEVSAEDAERFKWEFLNPILEQLCDWWEWMMECEAHEDVGPFDVGGRTNNANGEDYGIHHRTPYGFYNVLAEGGASELDEYLDTGSEVGLERVGRLFEELE
jgi:hypothetical protein